MELVVLPGLYLFFINLDNEQCLRKLSFFYFVRIYEFEEAKKKNEIRSTDWTVNGNANLLTVIFKQML